MAGVHFLNGPAYNVHFMNGRDRQRALTLELLQAIHGQSDVTQRNLADRLGVALGLANAYLRRCIRKGLIKVKQAPANRYLYYLTPKGFAEKSRLTAEYLKDSFHLYRRASISVNAVLAECARCGFIHLTLCGASELAEIALVRAREYPVSIDAVFDPVCPDERFLNVPVVRHATLLKRYDACIVTSISAPQAMYESVVRVRARTRILIPDILDVRMADIS